MNWNKDLVLKPNYSTALIISLFPCDKVDYYYEYDIDQECIADEDLQRQYLDPNGYDFYQAFLYYNYETFDAEQFEEEAIQRKSYVSELYLNPRKPKWIDFDFQGYELDDNTGLWQLGSIEP